MDGSAENVNYRHEDPAFRTFAPNPLIALVVCINFYGYSFELGKCGQEAKGWPAKHLCDAHRKTLQVIRRANIVCKSAIFERAASHTSSNFMLQSSSVVVCGNPEKAMLRRFSRACTHESFVATCSVSRAEHVGGRFLVLILLLPFHFSCGPGSAHERCK